MIELTQVIGGLSLGILIGGIWRYKQHNPYLTWAEAARLTVDSWITLLVGRR